MNNKSLFSIWEYRELLSELVKREIKARYKQSILGYAWVILVPLMNLAVLSIVFSFFIRLDTGGIPYTIFLFVALVPWTFTANAIASATKSLSANSSLITKIFIPREVFPIASITAKLVDLLLTTLILLVFLLLFKVQLSASLLYVPLIFVVHLLLVTGVSFILSAINVFFRDVENILSVLLMMWMYLTPVIYPPELIPTQLTPIFNLNPMMPIINAYRNSILHGVAPPWESFTYTSVFSLAIFIIGYLFFKRRAKYFADVV